MVQFGKRLAEAVQGSEHIAHFVNYKRKLMFNPPSNPFLQRPALFRSVLLCSAMFFPALLCSIYALFCSKQGYFRLVHSLRAWWGDQVHTHPSLCSSLREPVREPYTYETELAHRCATLFARGQS